MTREQLIEAMARGSLIHEGIDPDQKYRWSDWGADTEPHELHWHGIQPEMRAILSAMEAAIPGLSDMIDGKAVVVRRSALHPLAWEAERERCAKVADDAQALYRKRSNECDGLFAAFELARGDVAQNIAAAIRAMGEPT